MGYEKRKGSSVEWIIYIKTVRARKKQRERVNACAMVNTKTWRDELRRQGTAFPAWGQQDVKNAPKQSAYAKEEIPRYESMYRMGGSENQPQWKKNLRSEGSAFVPWSAPDPYDHFFEDSHSRDPHEGNRAPLAPKEGVFGIKTQYVSAFPRRLGIWKLSDDDDHD